MTDGCDVNDPGVDRVDWPGLYDKENYERLQAKRQWDPAATPGSTPQSVRLQTRARPNAPESGCGRGGLTPRLQRVGGVATLRGLETSPF